jgi:hypothetical protein
VDIADLEHRPDRGYDEQDPSRIFIPNDTVASSSDRDLNAVMVVEVIAMIRAAELVSKSAPDSSPPLHQGGESPGHRVAT